MEHKILNLLDIEQTVGGYMLAHNKTKGVDLRNAEVTIKLELEHNEFKYLLHKNIKD